MNFELRYPYPSIRKNNLRSYGGSQSWSESKTMRRCGCGVVAAMDLILYLSRSRGIDLPELRELTCPDASHESYDALIQSLSRRYFPLIYPVGINGVSLALGLNRYFHRHNMPFRASWSISGARIFPSIEKMLNRDIPVILSIGVNFPKVWGKTNLDFYRLRHDGSFEKAVSTRSHYVTVTGMDEEWLRISSWGNMYFVNRREYMDYIRSKSTALVTNVVSIREI